VKSFEWVGFVIEADLSPTAKLVAHTIAYHAGKHGQCFPSYQTLANESGLHRVTVIKCVNELVDAKLIAKVARRVHNGVDKMCKDQSNILVLVAQDYHPSSAGLPITRSEGLRRTTLTNTKVTNTSNAQNIDVDNIVVAFNQRAKA
jgi:predicted transcriptional regulator